MLTRLAVEWSNTLPGSRLTELTQESGHRFRLAFAADSGDPALIVCLGPSEPWTGAVTRRWAGPLWSPDPWVPGVSHALVGRRLGRLVKPPADRLLHFDFGDGWGLVVELAPQRANLIALGEKGIIAALWRQPRGARAGVTPGQPWSVGGLPPGRLDPFHADAAAIDAVLSAGALEGESVAEAIKRRLVGVGATGAALIVEEHTATGTAPGAILRRRLDAILAGTSEVLIEESDAGVPDRLLPWRPTWGPNAPVVARGGPAATAGWFHESHDLKRQVEARIAGLGSILRREADRARQAEQKVREGLRTFDDPERYRRMGEALLAGLTRARRHQDVVVVADPYDEDGGELTIPAPPDRPLTQVANELFAKHRRAQRGLAATAARAESLARRAAALDRLLVAQERTTGEDGAARLETEMRALGLAVGLIGPTRAARAAARSNPAQLAGVRIVVSDDGFTILVGRTGRDNDKLTFKIAAPDDLWLHAAGVPGAHVVIRNPERIPVVPAATLAEAARLALWFSDARSQGTADVQWTRRKYVRRAKGGASGKVVLKRFETIRVRAVPPSDPDGSAPFSQG